ncbi:MAG: biotin/lipoyl-containing protein [Bacteroidota bacterium]
MIILNFRPNFSNQMIEAVVNGASPLKLELDKKNPAKGTLNGQEYVLDRSKSGPKAFHILKDNRTYNVEVLEVIHSEKKFVLLVNGTRYEVELKDQFDLLLQSMGIGGANAKQLKEVKAPMPGLVLDILVQEGSTVAKGDAIVILEAMKMENVLKSPTDGTIKSVSITKGIAVEKNQVLISFN